MSVSTKRTGLGRNLSALLSHTQSAYSESEEANTQARIVPIDNLIPSPFQPRQDMDEEKLSLLTNSIAKHGLLQPIVVRQTSSHQYEIIAGERRWRACCKLGKTKVPVIVQSANDETVMALALIENMQREDLNAMDQARAMHRLIQEFALSHAEIAELLSKSRASVSNYLRLMQLDDMVKKLLENGDIEMGHARSLVSLEKDMQVAFAKQITAKQLSVRQVEKMVADIKQPKVASKKNQPHQVQPFDGQIRKLAETLQIEVQLKPSSKNKGRVIFHYDNIQRLEALLATLNGKH